MTGGAPVGEGVLYRVLVPYEAVQPKKKKKKKKSERERLKGLWLGGCDGAVGRLLLLGGGDGADSEVKRTREPPTVMEVLDPLARGKTQEL